MKVLMHICCGPCSISPLEQLKQEDIIPDLFWYNPNIHPFMEYKNRLESCEKYINLLNLKLIKIDEYGLREFCSNVISNLNERCSSYCYKVRMEKTAKYAKENGYKAFTTTLFVSPYQNHEKLKQVCEELAKKYEIEFLYRDFRPGFREGQSKARSLELYMQKYCGCVFSEEDRYMKK